jgi:Glycosyl transferases group 1
MKVAIIFATDGSDGEDAIVAPFVSAGFVDGLRHNGVEPVLISVAPDHDGAAGGRVQPGSPLLRCARDGLAGLIAGERPDTIQTFGPEHRLSTIWPLAADKPLGHCVACWRGDDAEASAFAIPSLTAARMRRASRHIDGLIGTSRAAVGRLIADGWFPDAAFSVVLPPPVERSGAAVAAVPGPHAADPVFGIYDPLASSDLIAFASHAIDLTGRRDAVRMKIAVQNPTTGGGPVSFVAAAGVDAFLSAVDVLVVPAYDDSIAQAVIAALRSGKSVIVPDRSGAAELIEYGRHGLMFAAGSAYHLANAMNLVSQSWSQTPVLLAEGGPAIARTNPAAVAQSFAAVYQRLVSAHAGERGAAPGFAHG